MEEKNKGEGVNGEWKNPNPGIGKRKNRTSSFLFVLLDVISSSSANHIPLAISHSSNIMVLNSKYENEKMIDFKMIQLKIVDFKVISRYV